MVGLIGFIISILLLVLQYKMMCHLVINSTLIVESKKSWILGFLLFGGIVSIIYYFSEYKKASNDIE